MMLAQNTAAATLLWTLGHQVQCLARGKPGLQPNRVCVLLYANRHGDTMAQQQEGQFVAQGIKTNELRSYGSKLIEKNDLICPEQCPNLSAQLPHTILRGAV